jgi:hypothetical protein
MAGQEEERGGAVMKRRKVALRRDKGLRSSGIQVISGCHSNE